jgi:Clc-like
MSETDHTRPEPSKNKSSKGEQFWNWITSTTFLGIVILIFAVVSVGWVVYLVVNTGTALGLPVLALLSIILLLGALLIFTTLINAIGLSNKNSALGLPDGSVRAILALALLGLFAILTSSVLAGHPKADSQVDEFGKQMLTLVGTLMTAVISFYFGSSTTPPAERGGAPPPAQTGGAPPPAQTGGAPPPAQTGGAPPSAHKE